MQQIQNQIENVSDPISDAVAIKKMRLLRKLKRKEAALIFSYSRSSIEKVENGRGKLTPDRVRRFVDGYGFTWNQFLDLKLGKQPQGIEVLVATKKIRIIEHVELRRSYQKIITKEVRTLRIFRRRKEITQQEASKLCGWCSPTIGHIEQGRIELTEDRIKHILNAYGFTLKEFYESVRSDIQREQIEEECAKFIQRLDDNRLLLVKGILEKF